MKTYYDGLEREIVGITQWPSNTLVVYWLVEYRRGESIGQLLVEANDELDAMLKFPEALARMSFNPDDEE